MVYSNPYSIHIADPPALMRVCRGQKVNVGFTLLNQSSGARVGPFHNRIRLTDRFMGHFEDSPLTWTVAEWDQTLEPWEAKALPSYFTVPWDLPAGIPMFIYVDVDWYNSIAESTEDDNHIQLMKGLIMNNVCY
jgi:hypothetical protein